MFDIKNLQHKDVNWIETPGVLAMFGKAHGLCRNPVIVGGKTFVIPEQTPKFALGENRTFASFAVDHHIDGKIVKEFLVMCVQTGLGCIVPGSLLHSSL